MALSQRKKWWEVATTQDELDLFHLLARNPKYDWRNLDSLLKVLRWTPEYFQQIAGPFLKMKIIVSKNSKKGFFIGYWERVSDLNKNVAEERKESDCSESLFDPNLI